MKILLTIHEKFLPDSGSAGSTFRLGQEYERLGHDVSFFSLNEMPKLQRQVKRFVFPEFVAAHVAKLSQTNGLDVVDGSPGDNWLCGIKHHLLPGKHPLLVTRSHGLQHLENRWAIEEAGQGRLELSWFYHLYRGGYLLWEITNSFRWADLAFFLNQAEVDYACQHLGVHPSNAHVFPNGMPESFIGLPFQPLSHSDNTTIRIAQIGTYIQRKGIEYSVPALKKILKRYPNVEVSFVGTGFMASEDPQQVVYKDFDPIFHPRIKVIPQYHHDMLPSLLKDHHINIFPSLSEGFGKALIEAMSCGLASVVSDADGPMEIVKDNHDALVVPRRNAAAIETAIDILIRDRNLLEKIRCNAYDTAQRYSWKAIAASRLAAYDKALQAKTSIER